MYCDHAKAQSPTHTDLFDALNCLLPSHDAKLYQLVVKTWNKVTIALLQRARNVQTIAEALVFNHTQSSKRHSKVTRATYPIPEPCSLALVQTILPAHLRPSFADPPTSTHIYTTPQRRVPCKHDRCQLYEAAGFSRELIIGRALYCPVCQIFNHAANHTYHIERALRSRLRLHESLSHMTFIPGDSTTLTTTRCPLMILREHLTQNITLLLNNLRSQHAHLIHTSKLVGDPNIDHPQSPITHTLHNLARTLNIPSCQHSTANPRPIPNQEYARYTRESTICP